MGIESYQQKNFIAPLRMGIQLTPKVLKAMFHMDKKENKKLRSIFMNRTIFLDAPYK